MVVAAKVKIVNNSKANVDGDNGGGLDVLKDLLKEFKGLKDIFSKASKLGRAGLGGGLLTGGAAGGLLSTIGAAASSPLGIAGLLSTFLKGDQADDRTGPGSLPSYEKVQIDGEEKVLEINQATGEILRTLTLRQAEEEGIVNKVGKMNSYYDSQNSIFDKITSELPKYRDAVILNAENAKLISAAGEYQLQLQEDINKSLKEIAERKAKEARRSQASDKAIKVATSSGYQTVGYGQLSLYEQMAYSNQLRSEEPLIQNQVSQQQSSAPPTGLFVDLPTSRET